MVRPSWEFPANPEEPYIHNRLFVPLDLSLAAAMLRERGIQVQIVDAHALRLCPKDVAAQVRGCDKVFITSSALDRWECPNTDVEPFVSCARTLAQAVPELYTMGVHGTVRPAEMLPLTDARAAIMGEPELAILDIAAGLDLEKIPGLCLPGEGPEGEVRFTSPRMGQLELDEAPLPAFDLLPMERYEHVIMGPRSVMLEASRGCPFKCTTCLQAMYGPNYRKKSGDKLIRDVRFAVEEHGARNITFIDMEFCLNTEAVEQLCDFLVGKRYDLQWCCSTRADAVNPELLRKMKAGGCSLIHYGVESGDQQVVDRINKRLELSRVEQAVRWTQEAGIEALAFFMFGLPGETWQQMKNTVSFANKLRPDYVSYHIFTPYPCTAAFEAVGEPAEPLFPSNSGEYTAEELDHFVKQAMKDFYLRPTFALRYARNIWRRGFFNQAKLFLRYLGL